MKKAAIATLGCKVNQVETSSIASQLQSKGYELVDFNEQADLYIINTCTVTNRTDFKSRNLIRHALKHKADNPEAKIIVTGCYAQKEKDEITALGNIDLIVDNQSKVDLDAWLGKDDYHFQAINSAETLTWKPFEDMHERTRAFIKIQDGCNYFCSYCAVPYGRGKPRSLELDKVISQANVLASRGYKEIVLTGVNLGLYHDKTSGFRLAEVIKAMDEIDSLKLLRISSIEPDLWTDELLNAIAFSDKVCPHFHIPLQSGSDSVLQRMKRRYRAEVISELIVKLESVKPGCAIGLDIICGFPGETEAESEETFRLVNESNIAYLHVFGYSRRSRTPAADMAGQLKGDIIKSRVRALTELSDYKKNRYAERLTESETSIRGVIEKVETNYVTALSDHYLRMYAKHQKASENEVLCGKAAGVYRDGILVQSSC
jgi:threonylcarbamoyladenosine tRNA methylthiotransferase MtaB